MLNNPKLQRIPKIDTLTKAFFLPTYNYSRSPTLGNPIASIRKSTVEGIPARFGLSPVSNFMGFTVLDFAVEVVPCGSFTMSEP